MTNYLDDDKPIFKPKPRYIPKDNQEDLENLGHEEITEDFSDSPTLNK